MLHSSAPLLLLVWVAAAAMIYGHLPCGMQLANLPTCQIAKLPKCLSAHQLGPPMGHAHGARPWGSPPLYRQPRAATTCKHCQSKYCCTVEIRQPTAGLLSGQPVRNRHGLAEITYFRGLGTHSPHIDVKFCKPLTARMGPLLGIVIFGAAAAHHIRLGVACKIHATD